MSHTKAEELLEQNGGMWVFDRMLAVLMVLVVMGIVILSSHAARWHAGYSERAQCRKGYATIWSLFSLGKLGYECTPGKHRLRVSD
jgi:hypothetical protein